MICRRQGNFTTTLPNPKPDVRGLLTTTRLFMPGKCATYLPIAGSMSVIATRNKCPVITYVRDLGDQSVVVLRDHNGAIDAYHNVCRHRAHRLLEGSGKTAALIVCPYHNWTYSLTGDLKFARHSDQVAGFDRTEFSLSPVRVESLCGFWFINLNDQAGSLVDGLDKLEWEIRELSPDMDNLKRARYREIRLAANWKNSVEN